MVRNQYVYTFVKSGEQPPKDQHNGMVRRTALMNAKVVASRDSHTQDVFRKPVRSKKPWELFQTVRIPLPPRQEAPAPEPKPAKSEHAVENLIVQECIRVVESTMPSEAIAAGIRPLHFRREGMKEAVDAIRRHFGIE